MSTKYEQFLRLNLVSVIFALIIELSPVQRGNKILVRIKKIPMATNFFLRCFAYFTTAVPYDRPLRTSEVVITIIITLETRSVGTRQVYVILYYNTVYTQDSSRIMITHTSFSKILLITPPSIHRHHGTLNGMKNLSI